jgi:ferredoxin-NADP reductase
VTGPDPAEFGWWLASRAAGVVALLCIAVSVGVGLAMAGRVSRRPALARALMSVHQQAALVGLVAIAVHGITLLGDRFLAPSAGDLLLPFTSTYEPLWTGLGVTAWWLAAILGLSFWVRHRIGARLWRTLHRATVLVYVLSVAHVLGAGTDAAEPWMRALLLATGAPILFLFLMRLMTPRGGPSFRRFRVTRVVPESSSVRSIELAPADRRPVPEHLPGQFVTVRARLAGGDRATRSYSLSSAPRPDRCRISVKREIGGRVSEHLHRAVAVGDVLELSDPAGAFTVGAQTVERPLVLLSAGIGATPLLAMLEALAAERSTREVWWVHTARDGAEHVFRQEARAHLAWLARGYAHVRYTRPRPEDRLGRDHDAVGRLTAAELRAIGVPLDAEVRLCGPTGFVADLTRQLVELGADPERIRSESFGGAGGAAAAAGSAPSEGAPASVAFARSGTTAQWRPGGGTLLDLAEASAVDVPSSCRVGACHSCRVAVLQGTVRHHPEPAAPPPPGSALLCCAVPGGDVVLDA